MQHTGEEAVDCGTFTELDSQQDKRLWTVDKSLTNEASEISHVATLTRTHRLHSNRHTDQNYQAYRRKRSDS